MSTLTGLRTLGGALLLLSLPVGSASAQDWVPRHRMVPFHRGPEATLGDLDLDGRRDLVVGGQGAADVLSNDGTGRFLSAAPPVFETADVALLCSPVVGRFDGDGLPDVCGWVGASLRTSAGNGQGGLATVPHTRPLLSSSAPRTLAAGDLDGDGRTDLLVDDAGLRHWRTADDFEFEEVALPALAGTTAAVVLEDLDGDGDLDLVRAAGSGAPTTPSQLLRNDGGVFVPVDTAIDDGFLESTACATVDFDGDGDRDVFVANSVAVGSGDPALQLFRNEGGFVFTDLSAVQPSLGVFLSVLGAVALDLDGDGREELLAGRSDGALVALRFDPLGGTFALDVLQAPLEGWTPERLLADDVDGDGDTDLLVGSSQQLVLFLNDGQGLLVLVEPDGGLLGDVPTRSAALDADLDGDLDLALAFVDSDARLLAGSFGGDLRDGLAQLPRTGEGATDVVVADWQGDGLPDLALGGRLRVFENQGGLTFVDAPARLVGLLPPAQALAPVDVDRDGDLDLAVTFGTAPGATVFVNDGQGVLVRDTARVQGSQALARSIGVGDFDRDGDQDLVLGGDAGTSELLENQGGSFNASLLAVDFWPTTAVVPFDADGDLDLDLYLAKRGALPGTNNVSATDVLLLNDGTGAFTDGSAALPPAERTTGAVVALDFDEDGDVDLASLEALSIALTSGGLNSPEEVRLLENDGTGLFSVAHEELGGSPYGGGALVAADFDGDQDVDLAVEGRVLLNTTSQLHFAGVPRAGKRTDLQGFGPPGGLLTLVGATSEAALPLGLLGTLRLDPGSAVVFGSVPLDGQGRFTLRLVLPLALQGTGLCYQAFVSSPGRFTNLEMASFRAL